MGTGWRFGLLGPLEVVRDDVLVPVRAAKQRILLASLLIEANRVVSVDELIARLWEFDPPAGASTTVRSYVMRLRRVLGRLAPIVTKPDGYLVQVDDGALDVQRFDSMVHAAAGEVEPVRTADLLREALELWRGTALSDVPSTLLREKVVPGWEERRLLVVESRVDADLALGRHRDLVPELAELIAEHPFREKFWQQRMLALYRSGRQADALECYRTVAELLAEELGVDPGQELREAHRAVLTNEAVPASNPRTGRSEPLKRNDLPGDVVDFAGRDDDMRRLSAVLETASGQGNAVVISAIDGMAGIGKTALAVHTAHQFADRYSDAQLFVDLRAHTADAQPMDPASALGALLRALGVAGARIPVELDDRVALWRSELADLKALIVLDNAASAAQVRPLLPGAPGCLVLITSRRRLTDLDTASTLSLDVLAPADALNLFRTTAGAERVDAETSEAETVVRLCEYLPLAVRIAAARLRARPAWSVSDLSRRLAEVRRKLVELETGDRSVASAFDLSYRGLEPDDQRLFRFLGLLPGSTFDSYVAAAVVGVDLVGVERSLQRLVDVHLLQELEPGRYRFHDLLREYARASAMRCEAEAARDRAIDRVLGYYAYVSRAANSFFYASQRRIGHDGIQHPACAPEFDDLWQARYWCESEHENIVGAIRFAYDKKMYRYTWLLSTVSWPFFRLSGHVEDWIVAQNLAVSATRELDEPAGHAEMHRILGNAYFAAGNHSKARECSEIARAYSRENGDTLGEGAALSNIASVNMLTGRYAEAVDDYQESLRLAELADDKLGCAIVLSNLGLLNYHRGENREAIDYCEQAIEAYRSLGDLRGEAMALGNLGMTYTRLGDYAHSIQLYSDAIAIQEKLGNKHNYAITLSNLGVVLALSGEHERAVECGERALGLVREVGDRRTEAEAQNDLADSLRLAGDVGGARRHYEEALALAFAIDSRPEEAKAYKGLGYLSAEVDPDLAWQYWRSALAIYIESESPEVAEIRRELDRIRDSVAEQWQVG